MKPSTTTTTAPAPVSAPGPTATPPSVHLVIVDTDDTTGETVTASCQLTISYDSTGTARFALAGDHLPLLQ